MQHFRHWLRLIETMTAFDDYIDPEDVIDYADLVAFAQDLITHGPPRSPFADLRYVLSSEEPPKRKLPYTFQQVLRTLLAPQHRFCEQVWGADGPDPDWWVYAKDLLVRAFPQTPRENDSLRLPGRVGYKGATRIVGIVEVTNGKARVVKGSVPPEAADLVYSLVD